MISYCKQVLPTQSQLICNFFVGIWAEKKIVLCYIEEEISRKKYLLFMKVLPFEKTESFFSAISWNYTEIPPQFDLGVPIY